MGMWCPKPSLIYPWMGMPELALHGEQQVPMSWL